MADKQKKGRAPRKPKAPEPTRSGNSHPASSKSSYGGKVHGPAVPGAEARPIVGKARALTDPAPSRVKRKKGYKPPKDEVERSERYVTQQTAVGMSQQAIAAKRAYELKRLLDPLSASLVQVQSDIAHDKKVHPAVRLDAADRLLNRLYGKPTERVEVMEPEGDAPVDEVRTLLNRILESVGAPLLEFDGSEPHEGAPRAGENQEAA